MQNVKEEDKKIDEHRLPISEHLEELRSRIIHSIIVIIVIFFICWIFKTKILNIVKVPHNFAMGKLGLSQSLQVLSYQEGFYAYIKLCLISAVFLGYPVILFQIWKFASAGLYKKERRYVKMFAPISYLSFIIGVLFGYFLLIPFGLQFLMKVLGPSVNPVITMSQYISLVSLLTIALGIVFQLPLIMLFIAKIGMLKAEDFIKWRMYSILIIFILAAVITPPDPFTQLMTAIPMIALYEIGILAIRPTKKSIIRFGILLGSGAILICGIFMMFTLPTKAKFLHTTGIVKMLPPAGAKWLPLTSESKIQHGATMKTGKISKATFLLKDGSHVILDVDTEIKLVGNRKIDLLNGQILVSIEANEAPFMITANDSVISANDGSLNIKISGYKVLVTATEGVATVMSNGEEKKIFNGRQLKLTTGGVPVKIETVIKWAKEMQKLIKKEAP